MNFDTHRAGLLLHPTSLPSGTLADVDRWLDFLQAAGLGCGRCCRSDFRWQGCHPISAHRRSRQPALFPLGEKASRAPICALRTCARNSDTGSTITRASWSSRGAGRYAMDRLAGAAARP